MIIRHRHNVPPKLLFIKHAYASSSNIKNIHIYAQKEGIVIKKNNVSAAVLTPEM